MFKTDDMTVQHFAGLEMMGEIAVVVSHRFNCFVKIVLSMIIKLKFKLIHYNNLTIRIAHKSFCDVGFERIMHTQQVSFN